MKKSFKLLFSAAMAVILLGSCSKDDGDDNPNYSEKNVSIVLSYGGDHEGFEETLGLQITGNDVSTTNVEGVDWDETLRPDKLGSQFTRSGNVSGTVSLHTTKPISSCTLITSYKPVEGEEIEEPITVNIQYYVEDDLVETDNFTFSNQENSYQKAIIIQDYID